MRRFRLSVLAVVVVALLFLSSTRRRANHDTNSAPTTKATDSNVVSQSPSSASSIMPAPESPSEYRRKMVENVQSIYSAPISFYGQVQDQYGSPVGGAKIEYGAIDKFWEAGSNYQGSSDPNGLFAIMGIKGAGLTVGVSKEGYDGINGASYQSFGYGMPPDSVRRAPPTREKPAVFVLRKKALAERLFAIDRDVIVPKNGTPVEVSLKTGKPVEAGRGDLRIETWTSDQAKDAQGRYEWRCRLSVPGGGLVTRTEIEMRFEAPEGGYAPSIEFHMPQTAERWQKDHDGEYWVKLGNQTYARIRLRVTTGGGHFASITSYLNPSGSRNLEFDASKVIK